MMKIPKTKRNIITIIHVERKEQHLCDSMFTSDYLVSADMLRIRIKSLLVILGYWKNKDLSWMC